MFNVNIANARHNDVCKFCQFEEIAVKFQFSVLENERILAIWLNIGTQTSFVNTHL